MKGGFDEMIDGIVERLNKGEKYVFSVLHSLIDEILSEDKTLNPEDSLDIDTNSDEFKALSKEKLRRNSSSNRLPIGRYKW